MLTIGVVGSGAMGSGIAELATRRGLRVVLMDNQPAQLERAAERIRQSLRRAVERDQMSASAAATAVEQLRPAANTAALAGCDLVIEAVTEDPALKRAVFEELDRVCDAQAIFASNTSSIPIVSLAAATHRGEQVIGMHFTNPVPRSRMIELIPSIMTSPATIRAARSAAASLGLEVVECRDRAGFILNYLTVPYLLDAIRMVQDDQATREDVDRAMTLGMGYPIGPLALCDFVGLDIVLSIAAVLYAEFREPRYAPPPLLTRLVQAGWTGRKSGRGFYEHPRNVDR